MGCCQPSQTRGRRYRRYERKEVGPAIRVPWSGGLVPAKT